MFSFVSAGVNSDNLFNLVFTLILYGCLRIFLMKNSSLPKDRGRVFDFFLLATGLIIGFYTKKQIFIALPIVAFAFLLSQLRKGKKARKKGLAVLGIIVFLFFLFSWGRLKIPDYDPSRPSRLAESFGQYIFWHLKHTVAETIPWYWGVFNWLGVTLPGWVNRLQARLLILALIGILIYFWHQIKKKKILSLKNLRIIFLFGSAFIYYAAIIIWDYFFRQSHSFSFGMQGRYFFPTIASHLLFLIWGLLSLIPEKIKRFRQGLIKVLIGWWFIFQLIGLQTAARAYYQLWPLATFLNQVSQYKPLFLKGFTLLGLFLVFFISSLVFLAVYFINFPRSSRGFRAWLGRK